MPSGTAARGTAVHASACTRVAQPTASEDSEVGRVARGRGGIYVSHICPEPRGVAKAHVANTGLAVTPLVEEKGGGMTTP